MTRNSDHLSASFLRNTQAWQCRQQAPVRPKESLVRRRPRSCTPTCTRLWKMSTEPMIRHRPSSSGPRPPQGTRPLNPSDQNLPRLAPRRPQRDHLSDPTPSAATEVAASPNLTPPGPKINPRAPSGGVLATELMANLQKTVDTMARAACARSFKDSVFNETVQEQIKEVGKAAGRIYGHMEWVDKAHTNSVATLNPLHTVQQWSTAIHEELSGVSRQLTNLSDMLKQVLDCIRTFSEAPPAPTLPTKPHPRTGTPLCGATRPVHPTTPTPRPRSTPTIPEPNLPRRPL
jgi:hypothetical protein